MHKHLLTEILDSLQKNKYSALCMYLCVYVFFYNSRYTTLQDRHNHVNVPRGDNNVGRWDTPHPIMPPNQTSTFKGQKSLVEIAMKSWRTTWTSGAPPICQLVDVFLKGRNLHVTPIRELVYFWWKMKGTVKQLTIFVESYFFFTLKEISLKSKEIIYKS